MSLSVVTIWPVGVLSGSKLSLTILLSHRMNEVYRAWGALKSVLSNRGLRIKAKKCLYEGVIVSRRCMEQRHGV